MKKLKIALLLLCIATSLTTTAQRFYSKANTYPLNTGEFYFVDNGDCSIIIDRDLTTNKEYITYLSWLKNVFSDYPEIYYKALPIDTTYYEKLFSPEYANQAVKGINLKQAQDYSHWRTDIYNEHLLIREGLLYFDFYNQIGDINFSTEAYLCGQYYGAIKALIHDETDPDGEGRNVMYDDYLFLPSFHVASKDEISYVNKYISNIQTFNNEYKPDKITHILDKWLIACINIYDEELIYYNDKIDILDPVKKYRLYNLKNHTFPVKTEDIIASNIVNPDGKKILEAINEKKECNFEKLIADSILLNHLNLSLGQIDRNSEDIYYSSYNPKSKYNFFDKKIQENINGLDDFFFEKDYLGKMPYFIWIGDEKDGTPILLKRNIFDKYTDNIENNGFYCAMSLPYRMQAAREYNKTSFNPYVYKKEDKRYFIDRIEENCYFSFHDSINVSEIAYSEYVNVLISDAIDINKHLFYNMNKENIFFTEFYYQSFISYIISEIYNSSTKAYSLDYKFGVSNELDTLTMKQVNTLLGNRIDTVIGETNEIINVSYDLNQIKYYVVKELRLYDKNKKILGKRTVAINPTREIKKRIGLEQKKELVMTFWVKIDEFLYIDFDEGQLTNGFKCKSNLDFYGFLFNQDYIGKEINTTTIDIKKNKEFFKKFFIKF